jgi:effector-binding domain-containing protein
MKALKYIFILLLVVLIGGAIYFSLQEGSYQQEKTDTVNAPKELVYNHISDLNLFKEWNESLFGDNVIVTLGNQTKGVDAYLTFEDESGKGHLVITSLAPNDQVRMKLIYSTSTQENFTYLSYNLSNLEGSTQVQLTANGEKNIQNKFWTALLGSHLESVVIPELQESILALEPVIKHAMSQYSVEENGIVNTSGGYHLFITQSSSLMNMTVVKDKLTAIIKNYMKIRDIEQTGSVLVHYEKRDVLNNNALITVAVPVRERIVTEIDSNILCNYKEPEKAVKVTLKGDYTNLKEAWNTGLEFIAKNGLQRSEVPIYEIYRNNSSNIINPALLVTEVYLPVE